MIHNIGQKHNIESVCVLFHDKEVRNKVGQKNLSANFFYAVEDAYAE